VCSASGEYEIKLKDYKKNLISQCFVSKDELIYEYEEGVNNFYKNNVFKADILLTNNTTSVEILKVNGKLRSSVAEIVLPTDLISNNLKFIPDSAFQKDKSIVLNQMNKLLSEARVLIYNGQTEMANKILIKQLYPLVNESFRASFQRTSILDVGLLELQNIITNSIVLVDTQTTHVNNPFFQISKINDSLTQNKSKIRIDFLNQPSNPETQMIFDVYLDSQIVQTKSYKNYLTAESEALTIGQHNWHVRTFLINKKMWVSSVYNIKYFNGEILKLGQY
jgi:hypothetical protein